MNANWKYDEDGAQSDCWSSAARCGLFIEFDGTHSSAHKEWNLVKSGLRKHNCHISHANMPLAVEFLSGISILLLSHVIDMPSNVSIIFSFIAVGFEARALCTMMSVWNGYFKICHITMPLSLSLALSDSHFRSGQTQFVHWSYSSVLFLRGSFQKVLFQNDW